ncbi:MAG: glutathione peroxidase [Bacilli bacterium]
MGFYDYLVKAINGEERNMADFKGKVVLVVNVASKCGLTPQYEGLQDLYEKYKDQGLEILGFPSNSFMNQEPGTEAEIQQFCSLTYNVSFPMFGKIDVNGKDAHPLYQFLKKEAPGALGIEAVKWNFTKFLVDRDGNVVERFAPQTEPKAIEEQIVTLLKKA